MSVGFDFSNHLIIQREQLGQGGLRLRQHGGILRAQKITQGGKRMIQRDDAELRRDALEGMACRWQL